MTKCPKCQFDNREGIKFCEECGTKIELKCPECGAEIPFGRKFCGECGHNLEKLKETPSIDSTSILHSRFFSRQNPYIPQFA
jgi:uncharacterized membrane protein YvbJ